MTRTEIESLIKEHVRWSPSDYGLSGELEGVEDAAEAIAQALAYQAEAPAAVYDGSKSLGERFQDALFAGFGTKSDHGDRTMTTLLNCPFCGGTAARIDINEEVCGATPEDENYGGSFIECDECGACTRVHFDRKENLVDAWHRRPIHSELSTLRARVAELETALSTATSEVERLRAGLEEIAELTPATQEVCLASTMGQIANAALTGGAK